MKENAPTPSERVAIVVPATHTVAPGSGAPRLSVTSPWIPVAVPSSTSPVRVATSVTVAPSSTYPRVT